MVCVVPAALAPAAAVLQDHFGRTDELLIVVDQRHSERRARSRRTGARQVGGGEDRRRVRSDTGRRLLERRGLLVPTAGHRLPVAARQYASDLSWFRRLGRHSDIADDAQAARLVARFQSGDQAAFVQIYSQYFDRVYGFLNVLLRDHHAAEDVAQQAFVKAFQALPAYELRAGTPFRAWLFRIARNEGLGHLRKFGRIAPEEPERLDLRRDCPSLDSPLDNLPWISDSELLQYVERLPEVQRQVLVMRFMLGMKTDELAEVLGRSPQAVRKLEHRALRFLESRMAATRANSERKLERIGAIRRLRRNPVLAARRWSLAMTCPPTYLRARAW